MEETLHRPTSASGPRRAAGPERNHTTSRQGPAPDAATQAAEQGSTERPAGASGGSATNDIGIFEDEEVASRVDIALRQLIDRVEAELVD